MKQNVQTALDNVDMTYAELIDFANVIVTDTMGDIVLLVDSAYHNIENMSNDAIRDTMMRLALRSFSFSEIKEKAAFKAALAETIRKEAFAKTYTSTSGTGGVKDNIAIMETSAEIISEELYTLVASMFKTRLDELHRIVDVLKTVLMSRLSEAKLSSIEA